MEVKKRETTSIFEENGRKFKINSYDPMIGNYILSQVLTFILPFGLSDMLTSTLGSETSISNIPNKAQKSMGKNEFLELQKDILSTVEEVYESGNTSPVVRENGTYGIQEPSMSLFLKLIIASLAFNFKDFFEDIPLIKGLVNL